MDILNKSPGPAPNPGTRAESGKEPRLPERKRVPMSVPRQKLQVADLPGYHLHWALESRIPKFLQAGYEYVDADEVQLNQQSVATDSTISGNQDLGSRVKIVAGIGANGQTEYHVLMKQREEWYNSDCKELERQNAKILEGIFRGEQIMGAETISAADRAQMYVNQELTSRMKPLFHRGVRKAAK